MYGASGGGEGCDKVILCCLGVLVTDGQTDRLMDERTMVAVESLSRLKIIFKQTDRWTFVLLESLLRLIIDF